MRSFVTIILLALTACVNDHIVVADAPFECDSASPPEFNDILPIMESKCATAGCHNADNNYIPHLTTKEQVTANRGDCKSQIENAVMPPPGYTLTESEKEKILCWLNYGK
jgi:hypothetical protein